MSYEEYQAEITEDIKSQLTEYSAQPVLFVGAGLSRRWIQAPSWRALLEEAIENCPLINRKFAYYEQQNVNYPAIATSIADFYREWAWGDGKNSFPAELFEAGQPSDVYLKYYVVERLASLVAGIDWPKVLAVPEVTAFQAIKPHSIVTTNYDDMLERLFPQYSAVLSHEVITNALASLGEIIKVHGTVAEPASLVLTTADYEWFIKKRKYISAKLLTYFREHVVVFVGYSIEDQNIRDILSDIDEAFALPGELAPNLYFVEWVSDVPKQPQREKLIRINEDKSLRVKCIQANDFGWVFEAFADGTSVKNVSPKLLRTILARSYHLVRSDLPRKNIEVDFDFLEGKVSDNEEFAKLFGVATLADGTEFNARYPLSLTEVGVALGYTHWSAAQKILDQIRWDKGVDLKATDNRYHCKLKVGPKSRTSRYSKDLVEVMKRVVGKEEYELNMK